MIMPPAVSSILPIVSENSIEEQSNLSYDCLQPSPSCPTLSTYITQEDDGRTRSDSLTWTLGTHIHFMY